MYIPEFWVGCTTGAAVMLALVITIGLLHK